MTTLVQRLQRLESRKSQAPIFRNAPSNPPHFRNSSANVPINAAGPYKSKARNKPNWTPDETRMMEEEDDWTPQYEQTEERDEDWTGYGERVRKRHRPNPPLQTSTQARMALGNSGHPQSFQSRGRGQMFRGQQSHPTSSLNMMQNRQQQPLRGRGRGQQRSQEDRGPQDPQRAQSDQRSYQNQDSQQTSSGSLWSKGYRQIRERGRGRGRGRSHEEDST